MAENVSMTFKRGERLTAQKMNALAQLASQCGRGSNSGSRPGQGVGWKGGTTWAETIHSVETPPDKGRNKPFEIVPRWDLSNHVLSAYEVKRNCFHDGSSWHELSDVVIDHENVASSSWIYLAEISASTSQGIEIPLPESDKWVVIDNIMETMEYPKEIEGGEADVKTKWRLYNVQNGIVKLDVRDAFVQTGGNMEITGGPGNVNLDLSSLDWLTAQDAESSAQVWHYNNVEQGDLAQVNLDPEATRDRLDSWRFLARPEQGGSIQYVQLSPIAVELSSLSSEISALSVEISALSAELSVEVSSTTITGNVPGSVPIDGDIFVDAMLSSNVSCLTEIDQNGVSRMWLGAYYI